MLELQQVTVSVTGCYGRPDALEELATGGTVALRIAPNELLMIEPPAHANALQRALHERLQALSPGGLACDLSSGFAAFIVRGDNRLEAFARLCAIPPPAPPAFLQGLFAGVPAKILVQETEILVLVSSVVSHHLRERVLHACDDCEPRELPAQPLRRLLPETVS